MRPLCRGTYSLLVVCPLWTVNTNPLPAKCKDLLDHWKGSHDEPKWEEVIREVIEALRKMEGLRNFAGVLENALKSTSTSSHSKFILFITKGMIIFILAMMSTAMLENAQQSKGASTNIHNMFYLYVPHGCVTCPVTQPDAG